MHCKHSRSAATCLDSPQAMKMKTGRPLMPIICLLVRMKKKRRLMLTLVYPSCLTFKKTRTQMKCWESAAHSRSETRSTDSVLRLSLRSWGTLGLCWIERDHEERVRLQLGTSWGRTLMATWKLIVWGRCVSCRVHSSRRKGCNRLRSKCKSQVTLRQASSSTALWQPTNQPSRRQPARLINYKTRPARYQSSMMPARRALLWALFPGLTYKRRQRLR